MLKLLLPFLVLLSFNAFAEDSLLGVYCLQDTTGAKIYLNGKYQFDCQDFEREAISLPSGSYTLLAVLEIDAEKQKQFEEKIILTSDQPQRVKVQFSQQAVLTEYGKQLAAEKAKEDELKQKALQKQKDIQALQSDIESANKGDLDAIRRMKERYETGNGVDKNEKQVAYWEEKLKEGTTAKTKSDKIKQLETELEDNPYFYWTGLAGIVLKNGNLSEKSTALIGVPLFIVTDILTAPTVYFDQKRINEEINEIETQATRWANPDAMIANALSE